MLWSKNLGFWRHNIRLERVLGYYSDRLLGQHPVNAIPGGMRMNLEVHRPHAPPMPAGRVQHGEVGKRQPRDGRTRWGVALALTLMQHAAAAGQAAPALPEALQAYVDESLKEWEIPGAAIAVVKDGRPDALYVFGVLELSRPEAVDVDTIFDAASLAKSFTAAAIATLVDEQRLAWDDPVRKLLPAQEFPDPYLTANVTLRDLLCHRTGVAATNGAWMFSDLTPKQLIGLVKNMRIDAPFRTRMIYSNVGYTIAGETAAAAAGMSWEELVTQRLLVPLGMKRTTTSFDAAPSMGNCASGHAMLSPANSYEDPSIKGYVQRPTPRGTARNSTAPAGSLLSSVTDLATWMIFQLGDGTLADKRIISPEAMNQMHSPHIIIPTTPAMRAARQVRFFPGYGSGWQVMDYRGESLLWHTGAGHGQRAYMALFPGARLGIVVLLNSSKVEGLHLALGARIADHCLELPTRDYCAELREPWERDLRAWENSVRERLASRRTGTAPSLALSDYAGSYRDPLGLDAVVAHADDELVMRYGGGERAKLMHWHDDTFVARWENPFHAEDYFTLVSFELGEPGKIARLRTTLGRDAVDAVRLEP